MTLDNLVIKVRDFNLLLQDDLMIGQLKEMTLYRGEKMSGMTYEIDQFRKIALTRPVKAKALLAYYEDKLVGWALLSREQSDFMNRDCVYNKEWFNPEEHGCLLEVYVEPSFRRKGIGKKLVKIARKKASPYPLAFVPWDHTSSKFYSNFKHYPHEDLGIC